MKLFTLTSYDKCQTPAGLSLCFLLLMSMLLSACSPSDVQTSTALKTHQYADGVIKAAAISKSGHLSLIVETAQICLWENTTHKQLIPCIKGQEAENIELVGISSSEQYFFTSNQMSVRLYQLLSNGQARPVKEWFADGNIINDIAISANAEKLLLGFRNGEASVIDTKTGVQERFQQHRLDINAVALSSDGQIAMTGSSDKTAVLWQTDTGEKHSTLDHRTRVNHVDLDKDASFAFTIDSINDRFIWGVNNNAAAEHSELQTSLKFLEINDSAFLKEKGYFITGSPKQKIFLWRVADGEIIGEWFAKQVNRSSVLQVAFISPTQFAIITSDGIYQEFSFI